MAKILIIEDDPDIHGIMTRLLKGTEHEVLSASCGREALPLLKTSPDLILLDLMLPDTTGEELLLQVEEGTPVIAVSARSRVADKVDLLTRGCVDYVTKPFDNTELLARIEVALKFKKTEKKTSIGNIDLDDSDRKIMINGVPVRLTPTEYAIMKVLIHNRERVISRSELIEEASKDTADLVEESLKVHMSNLRKKLRASGSSVEIEAVWGIGFRLTVS